MVRVLEFFLFFRILGVRARDAPFLNVLKGSSRLGIRSLVVSLFVIISILSLSIESDSTALLQDHLWISIGGDCFEDKTFPASEEHWERTHCVTVPAQIPGIWCLVIPPQFQEVCGSYPSSKEAS